MSFQLNQCNMVGQFDSDGQMYLLQTTTKNYETKFQKYQRTSFPEGSSISSIPFKHPHEPNVLFEIFWNVSTKYDSSNVNPISKRVCSFEICGTVIIEKSQMDENANVMKIVDLTTDDIDLLTNDLECKMCHTTIYYPFHTWCRKCEKTELKKQMTSIANPRKILRSVSSFFQKINRHF